MSLEALQRTSHILPLTTVGRLSQEEMHLLSPRRSLPSHTLAGGRKILLLTQQPGPRRATAQRLREEFGRNAEANFSLANTEILFHLEQSVPRREGLGCEHLSVEDTGCSLCTRPPLHALRPAARPVISCLLLLYRHLKNGTKEGALAEN